ncbi:MAG: dephospho-CoA kinase [Pseudomonadales bacterium]
MVFVVGLTGGIGSGKTAVSDRFASLGVTIADADVSARTVVEPGTPALAKISQHFGPKVLQEDGSLDRAALRKIVFTDHDERKWLESVTVPAILEDLRHILDTATSSYAILMLSSGSGQSPWIDRNLVVDVPESVQIARVTQRDNNDEAQVRAIMATQPGREDRLAYADDVIDNTLGMSELDSRVAELHEQYLQLAANHPQQTAE